MDLFSPRRARTATVTASTTVEAWRLDYESLESAPNAPALMAVLAERYAIRRAEARIAQHPMFASLETIHKGWTAPQAAGVIHTDFERGFIRVEIYNCDDLFTLGTEAAVAAKGKKRMEGKEYVMRDGDVVHFRFNV